MKPDDEPAPADEKDIIDAEVIAEHPVREKAAAKTGMGFMAKAGWFLAFGVSTFAAGVYLAPRFDPGLVYLGLKEEARVVAPVAENAGADVAQVLHSVQTLEEALRRQQEILALHEDALKTAASDRQKLASDMAVIATEGLRTSGTVAGAAEIAKLQADITRLTDDIARLSVVSNADDPEVSRLTGALAIARAESSQLKSRLEALEQSMKAVESGALEASPRGRLVLSLGRIKDRALVGLPFGPELAALRPDFAALPSLDQQMIGADLATLTEHGAGIVPYEVLVRDFDAMASAALKAADSAEGNFLNKLFTVRRTDAGATGLDAQLLKAERALAARDIAGAVAALESLEGPALEASATWRMQAKAHVAVANAFDRLVSGVANAGEAREGQPS
jgi:hypothetical protein